MLKGFLKERMQSSRKGELGQLPTHLHSQTLIKGGRVVTQGRRHKGSCEAYIQYPIQCPYWQNKLKTKRVVGRRGSFPASSMIALNVHFKGPPSTFPIH